MDQAGGEVAALVQDHQAAVRLQAHPAAAALPLALVPEAHRRPAKQVPRVVRPPRQAPRQAPQGKQKQKIPLPAIPSTRDQLN